MIDAAPRAARPALLIAGAAVAASVRPLLAGSAGPASYGAAVTFALVLLALAAAAWRTAAATGPSVDRQKPPGPRPLPKPSTPTGADLAGRLRGSLPAVGIGLIGGMLLAVVPLFARHGLTTITTGGAALNATFLTWAVAVTVVACAEEILLRGAVFRELLALGTSPLLTVLATAVIFGLLHVPVYGWVAVPLDIAVGLSLGGLRLLAGSVMAPAVAHTLADLATWWNL